MPTAADPYQILESGQILQVPQASFGLSESERQVLLDLDHEEIGHHKNIAYRPQSGRISGFGKLDPASVEKLRAILRAYSEWAIGLVRQMLPQYETNWRLDYASLRPLEESGRQLSWKKRNDLLHTDAFPSRPTNGDLILRVFTNVHPSKDRVWVVSDPFDAVASKHAKSAGLDRVSKGAEFNGLKRAFGALGVPVVVRSRYDKFMLLFHDYLKANAEYQQSCPKYEFVFPPGATWMVFTDVVPHSVLSGQLALEQTFLISRRSLAAPERAPIAILERLAGTKLS